MRRCEPTGVQVESAIEYGEACITCGSFAHDADYPCGNCVARPERRDALRWAIETLIALGEPARLTAARKAPGTKEEEAEWRCDAIRTLAHEDEAIQLVRRVIEIEWPDRPHIANEVDLYLGRLPTNIEVRDCFFYGDYMPTALWPWQKGVSSGWISAPNRSPILLSVSALPRFVRILLAILSGPDAATAAFESACRAAWSDFGTQRVRWRSTGDGKWDWQLLIGDAPSPAILGPIAALRHAAELALQIKPHPPACFGCAGRATGGEAWCKGCLAILWAGELTSHFGSPRKAIRAVVERKAKPNTTLPEPFPPSVVNAIDRMVYDEEWLRTQLCTALGAREWCGVKRGEVEKANELVRYAENTFHVLVGGEQERGIELKRFIDLSAKQARHLLPTITAIHWFLPDARAQIVAAIKEAMLFKPISVGYVRTT